MSFFYEKLSGAGNDFLLIEESSAPFPDIEKDWIASLCDRKNGLGADGILLVKAQDLHSIQIRIFNADASEAEMCGNGLRCVAFWLKKHFPHYTEFEVKSPFGRHLVWEQSEGLFSTSMGIPTLYSWSQKIDNLSFTYLDTGVPHAVVFLDTLEDLDFVKLGSYFRHHPQFYPRGANINFCTIKETTILVRTYERGVEGETLACGTGATAVAIAAHHHYTHTFPICITVRSGDKLFVEKKNKEYILSGPATFVEKGILPVMSKR